MFLSRRTRYHPATPTWLADERLPIRLFRRRVGVYCGNHQPERLVGKVVIEAALNVSSLQVPIRLPRRRQKPIEGFERHSCWGFIDSKVNKPLSSWFW
ncbi:hypothetical protein ZHAS_00017212 [Anopheles sinensis]|uniref:Uncharacterized protein n=1 Tax=Anopheles sinensis TaxID=74873 RepID=A0A084WG66_ANOSI|nr:hypothetical protein ZHAS_00017212 [Anopheles sinensis]